MKSALEVIISELQFNNRLANDVTMFRSKHLPTHYSVLKHVVSERGSQFLGLYIFTKNSQNNSHSSKMYIQTAALMTVLMNLMNNSLPGPRPHVNEKVMVPGFINGRRSERAFMRYGPVHKLYITKLLNTLN